MPDHPSLTIPLTVANDVAFAGNRATVESLRLLLVAETMLREGQRQVTVPLTELRRLTGATQEAAKTAVSNLAHLRVCTDVGDWFCPVVGVLKTPKGRQALNEEPEDEPEDEYDGVSGIGDDAVSVDEDEDGPRRVVEAAPSAARTYYTFRHRPFLLDGTAARKTTPASVTVAFDSAWLAIPRDQTVSFPVAELAALRTRAALVLRLRLAGMLHAGPGPHRFTIDATAIGFYTGTDQSITPAALKRSYWDPALAEVQERCPSITIEAHERTRRGRLARIDVDVGMEGRARSLRPRRVRAAPDAVTGP